LIKKRQSWHFWCFIFDEKAEFISSFSLAVVLLYFFEITGLVVTKRNSNLVSARAVLKLSGFCKQKSYEKS